MTSRVRVGIIGMGSQGRVYAELITSGRVPGMELAALCASNPYSRRTAEHAAHAAELGVAFHTDYPALLDSGEVSAVIITTPHHGHPEQAAAALTRGVHTVLEKPAGVSTKQVNALLEVAARHPRSRFAMMFNQRTNPLYRDLRQLIASGALGGLRHTSWQITSWWRPDAYHASAPWRSTWAGEGGGVLVNQAPHQLDLWQWLCGPATRCFARIGFGFRRAIPVEDEVFALVEFGDQVRGSFSTCTHDLVGTDRLELLYDRGKVIVTDASRVDIWRYHDDERAISAALSPQDAALVPSGAFDRSGFWTHQTRDYTSRWGEQHAALLQNFAEHILEDRPLIAPGAEGIHSVRLANAMLLSAWTNRDVDLTQFDDDDYLARLNEMVVAEGGQPLDPALRSAPANSHRPGTAPQ